MPTDDNTKKTNMRIWNEVCEVDPDFTEEIKDGRGLTAIVPMFLIRQATELWGPMGDGWGFEIEREDCIYMNSRERPQDALHVMTIKLWYKVDPGPGLPGTAIEDKRHTYGMGCTKLFQKRGDEWYIDPDYNKSTLTDAITNALSRLGFGGSVRLQEHQSKYTTNLDARDTECEKAYDKYVAWRRLDPLTQTLTDAMLISEGVDRLKKNSRNPQNPEHILGMIDQ